MVKNSPHFVSTNNHDDFAKIARMTPLDTNNFVYGSIRLYNNTQVWVYEYPNDQCSSPEIKRNDFYSENDRYFGQFLDSCFNTRVLCSKSLVLHVVYV